MKAFAVHPDAIVLVSRMWQTTSTFLRAGDEAFLVDSPIFPDEVEALPAIARQAGFDVRGLLITHADWDHLLARVAFPTTTIGCSKETAQRLETELEAQRQELQEFDEEHYVERSEPLSVNSESLQTLDVPGFCELGGKELELLAADGHTSDGFAIWAPWAQVLICGDYLSPVEIPGIAHGGSIEGYVATLDRLRPIIAQAQTIIPGHGTPLDSSAALAVLDADLQYLQALERDAITAPLPPGRRSDEQQRLHADNIAVLQAA